MIVGLAGGVGGARLLDGLAQILGERLYAIVNTADDFTHLGLHISPDIDTVMYTLGGVANPETGWGVRGESWTALKEIGRFGGETWFQLGDRDLAVHILRTKRLREGDRLTSITLDLCSRLGISAHVLPMCDEPVGTIVRTADGELGFQEYFVRRRCEVPVSGFRFAGIERACVTHEVEAALATPTLEAIVICPSNPYVSIDPILAVPGLKDRLSAAGVPIIGVSPIIAGKAVKGPAAKMMQELGQDCSAVSVAARYSDLLTGFVIDEADRGLARQIEEFGVAVRVADTLMPTPDRRRSLATECLDFVGKLHTAK